MESNTLTLTQALGQGYTHFRIGQGDEERFRIFPLTKEMLIWANQRSADEAFDIAEGANEFESFFGQQTYLCDKPKSPELIVRDLAELIADKVEVDDEFSVFDELPDNLKKGLPESENFRKAVEMINNELKEYKTYTDTDILVTLE